jgi:hypothetical protein
MSLPSSEPTATYNASTSKCAGKKRSTGTGKDRKPCKVSARKAAEISNTTVLHDMQGTMNRVIDIFEKSITQPLDPHLLYKVMHCTSSKLVRIISASMIGPKWCNSS